MLLEREEDLGLESIQPLVDQQFRKDLVAITTTVDHASTDQKKYINKRFMNSV